MDDKKVAVVLTGSVQKCSCDHDFQTERYGIAMRVHTPVKKGGWRCTVCSKEKK
jgi:hypothetical protein